MANSNGNLVHVKTRITDKGVYISGLKDSEQVPMCKLNSKWIVVAGTCKPNVNANYESLNKEPKQENPNKVKKNKEKMNPNKGKRKKKNIPCENNVLDQSIFQSNIVEMHLDSVFKDRTTKLEIELFKCVNVRVLSLRDNNLKSLPVEIARLSKLRTLMLTDNCLTFNNVPYTLTFCKHLTKLYLDNNLLEALPGFLLEMSQLETVYRHGNDNYFKSTFLWYHTAERDRVIPLRPSRGTSGHGTLFQPLSLESHAIKAVIQTKKNFFTPGLIPATLQNCVANAYSKYQICGYCGVVYDWSKTGFGVFTFKSPFVGNTCVPFEHWTCSRECGVALEEPAYLEEQYQLRKQDREYQQYIRKVEEEMSNEQPDKQLNTCVLM